MSTWGWESNKAFRKQQRLKDLEGWSLFLMWFFVICCGMSWGSIRYLGALRLHYDDLFLWFQKYRTLEHCLSLTLQAKRKEYMTCISSAEMDHYSQEFPRSSSNGTYTLPAWKSFCNEWPTTILPSIALAANSLACNGPFGANCVHIILNPQHPERNGRHQTKTATSQMENEQATASSPW